MAESMWQLGLGSTEYYPERPGVPDCAYYMRTGFCGYGRRCRYNHPRDRAAVILLIPVQYLPFRYYADSVIRFKLGCQTSIFLLEFGGPPWFPSLGYSDNICI